MGVNHNRRMLARGVAFLIWAALAASAVHWAFKLFVTPLQAPAHTQVATAAVPLTADMSKLFGVEVVPLVVATTQPLPDARFQLVGVVAPRANASTHQGVALIAIDGRPAKAYRVGALIDGTTVLQSVQARGAQIGPRGAPPLATLQLPPVPVASTGTLPPAMSNVSPSLSPNAAPNMSPVGMQRPLFSAPTPVVQAAPTLQPENTPQQQPPSVFPGANPRRALPTQGPVLETR